jgi:hypothetical protein
MPAQIEYTVLMTKTTPFRLSFDFSTEGYDNVWDAMAATLAESVQPSDAILQAEYTGLAPNGWPMLAITFASIECAKAFTYVYLGYGEAENVDADVYSDDEVGEYIRHGKFVNA